MSKLPLFDSSIGNHVVFGERVTLGRNCIIEDDVVIGDDCYIDHGAIIRSGTTVGDRAYIGSKCILGEHQLDFCRNRSRGNHKLTIGDDVLIRSGTIIYTGSTIGDWFDTGHNVTVREKAFIGNHVMFGTLADIQGDCIIGDYVRANSNVHIARKTKVDSFVWIFPYTLFTNDPTPPSETLSGAHVHSFAVIASRAVILPGVEIGQDALVTAGAQVSKNVAPYSVVSGAPAKKAGNVRMLNVIAGQDIYPWREHFRRGMPWENTGFDNWLATLSREDFERYGFQNLDLKKQ